MEPNCILVQTPGAGTKVKEGRTIYVTINSPSSPKVKIPDVIDNSSLREAQARLTAIGFRLSEPRPVEGERDWVYGIVADGRSLQAGDMVSIEAPLTLVVGNGIMEEDVEDNEMANPSDSLAMDVDEFEEVTSP
jgi:beta-lactam-binding protein with PASTA domain